MCDIRDDDLPKILKKINLSNEQCKKCQGENGRAVFLLRNDDKPMCKKCFLLSCIHKFRSEFGKTQIVRQGEQLLIGFSGGPSSIALLLLIKQGLAESEFRKLRFSPVFVHIFDGDFVPQEIEEILINSGFPYHLIRFSDLPDDRLKIVNEKLFKTKFSTAYKNVKNILLKTILCDLAVKYECSRVMVGNNCSRQSIRVLSNIAQGSVSYDDTAFHDTRHNISIIQPMRQFSVKEIIFINRFNNISLPFMTNEETFTNNKTYSIDRLTEGFIASLTCDFPSTIFTISRTAEKMTSVPNKNERKRCRFCGNSYKCQNDIFGEATAANAMLFSQTLLQPLNGDVNEIIDGNDCGGGSDNLCYTCQSINDEIDIDLIK